MYIIQPLLYCICILFIRICLFLFSSKYKSYGSCAVAMHFVWFSHHKFPNPIEFACDEGGVQRRVVRNPSHIEYHTKCIFCHIFHDDSCYIY